MSNPIERLAQLRQDNKELDEVLKAVEQIDKVFGKSDFDAFHPGPIGTAASTNFSVSFVPPSATAFKLKGVNNPNEQQS